MANLKEIEEPFEKDQIGKGWQTFLRPMYISFRLCWYSLLNKLRTVTDRVPLNELRFDIFSVLGLFLKGKKCTSPKGFWILSN